MGEVVFFGIPIFFEEFFQILSFGDFFPHFCFGIPFFLVFFLNENLIHFWRGSWLNKIFKDWSWFEVFWRLKMVYCAQVKFSNVPTKREKTAKFPFPFTFSDVNGQSSEWDVFFCPREHQQQPTNIQQTFISERKNQVAVGLKLCQKTWMRWDFFASKPTKKGTFFHMGGGLIGWFSCLLTARQMENRLKLLGITYLAGKIGHLNFYFMVPSGWVRLATLLSRWFSCWVDDSPNFPWDSWWSFPEDIGPPKTKMTSWKIPTI